MTAPLEAVARFAATLAHVSWFAAVGEPLTDTERDDAADYLTLLGFADVAVAGIPSWTAAREIASDPDWDRRWWDAEEALRTELTGAAGAVLGETAVLKALTRVADAASDVVHGAAAVAAARAGVADPALLRSAAGAATQAAHLAGLALVAGMGADHVFRRKFRLFEGGRWPLCVVHDRFFMF